MLVLIATGLYLDRTHRMDRGVKDSAVGAPITTAGTVATPELDGGGSGTGTVRIYNSATLTNHAIVTGTDKSAATHKQLGINDVTPSQTLDIAGDEIPVALRRRELEPSQMKVGTEFCVFPISITLEHHVWANFQADRLSVIVLPPCSMISTPVKKLASGWLVTLDGIQQTEDGHDSTLKEFGYTRMTQVVAK